MNSVLVRVLLLFALFTGIGYLSQLALIKVDIETEQDNALQIFWASDKENFLQQDSTIKPTTTGRHSYWFLVNGFNKGSHFRVDPVIFKSRFKLYEFKIYSLLYYPSSIDLYNDPVSSDQLQVVQSDVIQPYVAMQALGEDPKLQVHPVFEQTPWFLVALLTLAMLLCLPLRCYIPVLCALLIFSAAFRILELNQAEVSFIADADQSRNIYFLWRDTTETFSNARTTLIRIKPGKHYYHARIGQFTNIEKFMIKVGKNPAKIQFSKLEFREPGFKPFRVLQADLNKYSDHISTAKPVTDFNDTTRDYYFFIEKKPETRSLLSSVVALCIGMVFFLGISVYVLKQHYRGFLRGIPYLISCLFFFAGILVFILAWQADYNLHPDEHNHIESIKYYSKYWDPPVIGDSRALEAYQYPWGISRLDELGVSYFFAGKFRYLLSFIFDHETALARTFNGFLFVVLVVLARQKRWAFYLLPILCTPQIAYLFSYANRGAPDLFLSILLGWQLVNKNSSLNQCLNSREPYKQGVKRLLLPGLLLGLLSLEQNNYLLFILYVCAYLLWKILFILPDKKIVLTKCLIFLSIGAAVFLVRYSIDLSINGLDKHERRMAYAEQHAGDNFKPSQAASPDSYIGLRLKQKGVSFLDLFSSDWQWHKISFESFTGFYGYYAELSPRWYYLYFFITLILFFTLIGWQCISRSGWRYQLFNVMSFVALLGGALMSLLFSWLHDFQPQGRYMFPVIPIMMVYLQTVLPTWDKRAKSLLAGLAAVFLLLSFFSFYRVALNYITA